MTASLDLRLHDEAWIADEIRRPFGRGVNFQIEIDDIDLLIEEVTKSSINFFREPMENWYTVDERSQEGQREFLVQDPDGYLLRFVQPLGRRKK